MGNFCASRTDPEESRRQYEKYTFLRQQIVAKLSDEVLANECGHLYAEECRRRRVQVLSKANWEEVCLPFIARVSCNDPQTQERIWQAVEELYPGPPDRSVSEATFVEFHRLVLTLAEEELRLRIAKVKDKYGGAPPPVTQNIDWMSELLGNNKEREDLEPLQITPRNTAVSNARISQSDGLAPNSLSPKPEVSRSLSPAANRTANVSLPTACSTHSSPRISVQSSPRFRVDETLGSRLTLSSDLRSQDADCEAVGSQISYVLKEPRPELAQDTRLKDSRGSLMSEASSLERRRARDQEQVAEMRSSILRGQLEVMIFNKRLQPEARRLGLNPGRMQILRADGSCEDSWDVKQLQCISFGIASNIVPKPPPAEKTLSFRFHFQQYGSEARYLCAMFNDGTTCRFAAAAFSQLCGVPVTTSEPFSQI
ncbi:unnamed protein product [Durusdinium trenchii]|uniref:Uncharacterized protein n=2 Tax=Durusdinium trenchii TaxID=1381693 RepID=A0ABP0HY28_9DINO